MPSQNSRSHLRGLIRWQGRLQLEDSQRPDPTASAIKAKIETELQSHHAHSPMKQFTYRDRLVESIWRTYPLEDLDAFKNCDNSMLECLRRDYLLIISILIYIGWDLLLFEVVFYRNRDRVPFTDEQLPYEKGLHGNFGTREDDFIKAQFKFLPHKIKHFKTSNINFVEKGRPLPFIEESEPLGEASAGKVTKCVIAARHLVYVDANGVQRTNAEVTEVACKEFVTGKVELNFKDELRGLDFLREPLTRRDTILKHLTAIIYENRFYILFPYMHHGNLEDFLVGNYDRQVFIHLANYPVRCRAIIKQIFDLADALQWLHTENEVFGEPGRYLARMDLKPENILIDGNPRDEQTSAGKWRISDFGLSAHTKSPPRIRDASTPPITYQNFAQKLSPSKYLYDLRRAAGPYQAPEVALEHSKFTKLHQISFDEHWLDERMADSWSFACIMCSLLGIIIDVDNGYKHSLRCRSPPVGGDDNFFEFKNFELDLDTRVSDNNAQVKPRMVDWWQRLEGETEEVWRMRYLEILRNTMVVDQVQQPAKRKDMTWIKQQLQFIFPESPNALVNAHQYDVNVDRSDEAALAGPSETNQDDRQDLPSSIYERAHGVHTSNHGSAQWRSAVDGVGGTPYFSENSLPPIESPHLHGLYSLFASLSSSATSSETTNDLNGHLSADLSRLAAPNGTYSVPAQHNPPTDPVQPQYLGQHDELALFLDPQVEFEHRRSVGPGMDSSAINATALDRGGDYAAFLSGRTIHPWCNKHALVRPWLKLNYPYIVAMGRSDDGDLLVSVTLPSTTS